MRSKWPSGLAASGNPCLLQHPQRVLLAGRLDDPRQHQLPEHLIAPGGPAEADQV